MAAVVESAMRELHVYGSTAADVAEGSPCKPETAKAVLAEEPGTPAGKQASEPTDTTAEKAKKQRRRRGKKAQAPGKENVAPAGPVDVAACVEINQCDGCTKSFLGNDAAVLAPSSGEEPASPRHRAGVASMV